MAYFAGNKTRLGRILDRVDYCTPKGKHRETVHQA
jgi:hypothetical protein